MKAIVGGTIFEKKSVFVAQSEDGRDRPVALQRQTNIEVIPETIDQRLEPSLGLRRSPVPPACDNEEIIKTIADTGSGLPDTPVLRVQHGGSFSASSCDENF